MSKPKLPWVKMALYFPLCLFNVAVGLCLLLLPPAGWLVGIPLLVLSCLPYATWISKHIHASIAYEERDKPLLEGEDLPWEESGDAIDETLIIDIIMNQNGRGRNE